MDIAKMATALIGEDLGLSSPRRDIRTKAGIYLLWKNDRIVYVGQALSVLQRAADHCQSKHFDASTYKLIKPSDLDFVESYLIWFFRPEFNRHIPLLGKVSQYSRVYPSVKAKLFVLECLSTIPEHDVVRRFQEAVDRGAGTCRQNSRREARRLWINEHMRQLYISRIANYATKGAKDGR